ncbi:MAG: LysR family transcriptional regulator [Hydrogenibacillus schlegelii]|uniref:LysR family transcriptional regulator n=1 Tax=Hydrogenibacillus schlegelii TaxID=1484 RepID=A0A947CYB2_HYDSH|nr:LysR family transcriptional regulator [Hydrogenibacillus schlegelii]
MELTQIRYFVEVARREHVTEAAFALNVAQSAVSRQIQNLEDELGVALFVRDGRRVRLTAAGSVLLEHMENVLREIEAARRRLESLVSPETGRIRLGFPSSLASYMLPTVLSAYRRLHPQTSFELHQGMIKELLEKVAAQALDLAFVTPPPRGDRKLSGFVLFDEEMVALLPADHPLTERAAREGGLPFAALKEEPFILFRPGMLLRTIVDEAARAAGFQPKVAFEGDEMETVKGLVAAGLGVAVLPEVSLIENVPRSAVKVRIVDPPIRRSVGIAYDTARPRTPAEEAFLAFLKEFFRDFRRFGA